MSESCAFSLQVNTGESDDPERSPASMETPLKKNESSGERLGWVSRRGSR